MSTIGILGSGRVGTALATKLAAAGHDVTVGSRTPSETAAKWSGPAVRHADHRGAVAAASIVVNASPGDTTLRRLSPLRSELDGKILVDLSNATTRTADGLPAGLAYPDSSLAEELQRALPGTSVVKTLNTMLFTVMTDPRSVSTPTAFLSGDDAVAKQAVSGLLADLGWPPEWIEDLGGVETARATEALVLIVPHLLRRHGLKPFAISVARNVS